MGISPHAERRIPGLLVLIQGALLRKKLLQERHRACITPGICGGNYVRHAVRAEAEDVQIVSDLPLWPKRAGRRASPDHGRTGVAGNPAG